MDFPFVISLDIFKKLSFHSFPHFYSVNSSLFSICDDWELWLNILSNKNFVKLCKNDYFNLNSSIPNNIFKKYIRYVILNQINIPEELYSIYTTFQNIQLFKLCIKMGKEYNSGVKWNKIGNTIDIGKTNNVPLYVKKLKLFHNQITEIKNLNYLVNLQELYLTYNHITEIKNLTLLINLQILYLSSNHITEIKNLFSLVNLQKLYLSGTQIPNINPASYKFLIFF
jgi:hypothetical protein